MLRELLYIQCVVKLIEQDDDVIAINLCQLSRTIESWQDGEYWIAVGGGLWDEVPK